MSRGNLAIYIDRLTAILVGYSSNPDYSVHPLRSGGANNGTKSLVTLIKLNIGYFPNSKPPLTILSAVAQAERRRVLECTNEGPQEAKLKGMKFGRRCSENRNTLRELHNKGTGAMKIARQLIIADPRLIIY